MKKNLKKGTDTFTLDKLLPGDILTFKGDPNDTISSLIMRLTNNSDVSHGAIFVQQKDFVLAEAGELGIHAHMMKMAESGGSEVYVLRHQKANRKGVQIAANIAKDYVLQDLPYPFSDLILLGLILLFKNGVKQNFMSKVVVEFLSLVAAEIKSKIDGKKGQDYLTMVCSSYVYQCYLDASKKDSSLKLNIKDGDAGVKVPRSLTKKSRTPNTLLDVFEDLVKNGGDDIKKVLLTKRKRLGAKKHRPVKKILEELEKELSVKCREKLKITSIDFQIVKDFVLAIKDIAQAISEISNDDNLSIGEMIQNLRKFQAMFVTPNDLRYHLTNADYIGLLKVNRSGSDYDDNFKK